MEHGKNGYLYAQDNVSDFLSLIIHLNKHSDVRKDISYNALMTSEKFELSQSLESMKIINETLD